MPSYNTYCLTWVSLTLGVGYLFMAAPAKRSHCSLPWTRGISWGLPEDWGNRLLEDFQRTGETDSWRTWTKLVHTRTQEKVAWPTRSRQTCLCASRKWKWGQAVEEPVSDSSNEKGGRRRAERGVVGHPFLNWMSNSAVLRRRWVPSLRFHLKDNSCSIRVAASLSHLLISHLAGLLLACALKWLDPATWWPSLLPCHF